MTLIFYYQFTYLNQQQKYRTITYEIVKTEIIKKNYSKMCETVKSIINCIHLFMRAITLTR